MKTNRYLALCLTALAATSAFGQPTPAPAEPPALLAPPTAPTRLPPRTPQAPPLPPGYADPFRAPTAPEPALTTFDLDFPGGTPKQLVAAIQEALKKANRNPPPLNALVPDEHSDMQLPALKLNAVNVPQLFEALIAASRKTESYSTGGRGGFGNYQMMETSYGFRTTGHPTDESIWYFYVERPNLPPATPPSAPPAKVCRFYSLAAYLENGSTEDDITTAIRTGWKMLGDSPQPTISFHKETKLLIAVGEPDKLETIEAVLQALRPQKPMSAPPAPATPPPAAKPAARP